MIPESYKSFINFLESSQIEPKFYYFVVSVSFVYESKDGFSI